MNIKYVEYKNTTYIYYEEFTNAEKKDDAN